MICDQLKEVNDALVHLNPQPSLVDVTRAVCAHCGRTAECPTLSMEQAEFIQKTQSVLNSGDKNTFVRSSCSS